MYSYLWSPLLVSNSCKSLLHHSMSLLDKHLSIGDKRLFSRHPKHGQKRTLHQSQIGLWNQFQTEEDLRVWNRKIHEYPCTMLQKFSKSEVKVWLCWNLIILPPLRFCVKLNFGEFKQSKNVNFGNFRGSEFWFLSIWAFFKCHIYQNSKFGVSKIAKIDIFGLFDFAKIGFYLKSECR